MLKKVIPFLITTGLLASCAGLTVTIGQVPSSTPAVTQTPAPTATPEPTATPSYPPEGYGPVNFPANINPLTGLEVEDTAVLDRRSVVVKIENLPRGHRPQSGLSAADIVFEYYTEFGSTRFAAVYYGQNPARVGPVRSARHFDANVVQAYKSIFVFASAYYGVMNRLYSSNFSQRLMLESRNSYPAMYRDNSNGDNLLFANIGEVAGAAQRVGINNERQNLDGMFFMAAPALQGQGAKQLTVHYSRAVYCRWDYNPQSGLYERWADTRDAGKAEDEDFAPLTDKVTGEQLKASNVVVLLVPHYYRVKDSDTEVVDVYFTGSGAALLLRDGQIFSVKWNRDGENGMLTLTDEAGNPFPLKPGNTWYQVVGAKSQLTQPGADTWRVTFGF